MLYSSSTLWPHLQSPNASSSYQTPTISSLRHPIVLVVDFVVPFPKLMCCFTVVSLYEKALKTLGIIDVELKLVIAGNHDLDLDKEWWDAVHDNLEGHLKAVEV